MSRAVPWRNKPTQLIKEMIPVAKQLKLYFVHQIGPTNLVLKDQNSNKFKVVIGDTVNCSCAVVKNDHCIHSLFVLLKKFKVSQTHPILWQASYLDSQLDGLAQQKYQQSSSKIKKKIDAKQFLKRKKQQLKQQEENFPQLDLQQVCPICYEDMSGQCYSSCEICHKFFHTACFKVWTKHKEDSNNPVTCPMCRNKFTNPMKIISKDLEKWETRFLTHKNSFCRGCGQKNIKGLIYKCLICTNYDLCKMCYEGNQHLEHDFFGVKQLITDKWRLAEMRIKKTKKQLFQPIEPVDVKQLPKLQSLEFVFYLLPTLQQFNLKQKKEELGIVGNVLIARNICTKCHSFGAEDIIRLHCSHLIHKQCLLDMFRNQDYTCEIDGDVICPGYWSAIGIKTYKQAKKKTDFKFIRNHEELELLEKKILFRQTDPPLNPIKQQISTFAGNEVSGKQIINGINRISGMKLKQPKQLRPQSLVKKSIAQRKKQLQSLSVGGFSMKFGGNERPETFGNVENMACLNRGGQSMNNKITYNINWESANQIPIKRNVINPRFQR